MRLTNNYKDPNSLPSKQDIENKVLLSMLNTKDLNELVETITKSFKK